MLYEGVNFNEEEIKKISREEFESRHIGLFWLDRDANTRSKMLSEAYGIINPPKRKGKKNEQ